MSPEEEEAVMYVSNVEPYAQRHSFKEFQTKDTSKEVLTLLIPKSVIQREVIRLRDRQREAIIKLFWGNLDIPEIAYRMKLSRKSVKKLIETALVTIRQRLTSEEEVSSA